MAAPQERWCVVTGGRGFVARHLVDMLIRYEIYSVRITDLGPDIKLEPYEEKGNLGQALRLGRAQYVSMDLLDKSQVFKGAKKKPSARVALVAEVGAAWGVFCVRRCEAVVWEHNDSYSETKAEGEALVIKANGINGLLTCCIRPSSIFGPGDKLLVPSLVAAARAGKSKVKN
ncbi:hypothetical protein R6Q57_013523 [Mikania cordata]